MHGSLIDCHHRSSLSGNIGATILSSSENSLGDDEIDIQSPEIVSTTISSSVIQQGKISSNLEDVIEQAENEKDESIVSTKFFGWRRGHRRTMLTFFTICLFGFMTGVEYAVILPTAFDYVKTMSNADIYVGLILSFYSISGSVAGIIMGKISDVTGKVKVLILVSTVFEIVGNILYFATKRIHVVLLGRLIAGVGMGAVPPILADVAHRTSELNRTKAISILLGCRQLGLLIGPCFTLIIRSMNFYIGPIHINHLNGPGFVMMIVWIVLQLCCWFCFYDRKSSSEKTSQENRTRKQSEKSAVSSACIWKIYRDQYFRIEMFVLFFATFITYFNQTALETIVAAFTEKHFKWNSVHTSILFAFAGLEIILVYLLLVKVCSKRFEDRFLLLFGFLSLSLACVLGTFFTWTSHKFSWSASPTSSVDKRLVLMFIIFVILDLLGLPFIAATSVSLFTKLTDRNLQGFSQGIQRFIMGIGTIVGPLFASSLLTRLHIMMTAMLSLIILTLLALLTVFRRLVPLSDGKTANHQTGDKDRSSSLDNESDEPISPLTLASKKCYTPLTRKEDDEQQDSLLEKPSKFNPTNELL